MEYGVEVTHEDERDVHVAADAFQLGEQFAQAHAAAQGFGGRVLDDGPVGHRVAEGYADFQHVDAARGEGADDVGRAVGRGVPGTEVKRKDSLLFFFE